MALNVSENNEINLISIVKKKLCNQCDANVQMKTNLKLAELFPVIF